MAEIVGWAIAITGAVVGVVLVLATVSSWRRAEARQKRAALDSSQRAAVALLAATWVLWCGVTVAGVIFLGLWVAGVA